MAVEFEPMIGRYFMLEVAANPTGFIWKKQDEESHFYVFIPLDQMRANSGIFWLMRISPADFG